MDPKIIESIHSCELFHNAPESVLREITPAPEWVEARAGDILIRQGERRREFYLLASGRLSVFIGEEVHEKSHRVGEILPGEPAGEIAMLTDNVATATVQVAVDSRLVRFSFDSYHSYLNLIKRYPSIAVEFTRLIANRLLGQRSLVGQAPFENILLLPVEPGVDLERVARQLRRELSRFGATTTIITEGLGRETCDLLGRSERLDPSLIPRCTPLFQQMERDYAHCIYLVENSTSSRVGSGESALHLNWAELTLSRANLILLVANAGSSSREISDFERRTVGQMEPHLRPRTDLVLIHDANDPAGPEPSRGMAAWREGRHFQNVHHVMDQRPADFARMARGIAGKSTGLVLGGGGARAFAALGVIKALHEGGYHFDQVCGVSMGSFIAALYATGRDPQQIQEATGRFWVDDAPLKDPDIPLIAKIRGQKMERLLQQLFPEMGYEDLTIPCFALSADLGNGEIVVHDRGPVWAGVRASCSLPGIGPPMYWQGRYLVDGGVLTNVPTDILLKRMDGACAHMAAIRFATDNAFVPDASLEEMPTGWQLLLDRFNPFARPRPPVPRLFEILYRSATLASHKLELANFTRADLRFNPPIEPFGLLEFSAIDRIVDVGYRHAMTYLEGANR